MSDDELEWWHFDFTTPDAALGGFVRLTLDRQAGVAWYWAYLVGDGQPVLAVRDDTVEPPRGRVLELRAPGLWSAIHRENPAGDHWTVGLEALAVSLDDPADAAGDERGEPVALGLDLEWESVARLSAPAGRDADGCDVHGDVLVGRERIVFSGCGTRVLARASRAEALAPASRAWVAFPAGEFAGEFTAVTADLGPAGPRPGAPVGLEDEARGDLRGTARHAVPVPVRVPGFSPALLIRALCRYDASRDGTGVGWAEWMAAAAP